MNYHYCRQGENGMAMSCAGITRLLGYAVLFSLVYYLSSVKSQGERSICVLPHASVSFNSVNIVSEVAISCQMTGYGTCAHSYTISS